MSTLLKLVTISTSAILLGGCTLPMLSSSEPNSTENPSITTSQEDAASKIAAAMQSGEPIRCTAEMADGTARYEYFMSGKKFRMDGTVTTEGKTEAYHAINDSTYLYSWSESQNQGIKIKMPTEAEMAEQKEKYDEYMNDLPDFSDENSVREYEDQGYSINCQPASVDQAMFTPDSSIEFSDMSAMMQQMQQTQEQSQQQTQKQMMPSLTPEQQQQFQEALQKMGN